MPHNNKIICSISMQSLYKNKIDISSFKINTPCIYFLFKENKIVYVGQTTNIYQRITTHKKSKNFDSFSFFDIYEKPFNGNYSSNELELYFILKFTPKYNVSIPPNEIWLTIEKLKEKYSHLLVRYQSTGLWIKWILRDHSDRLRICYFSNKPYIHTEDFEKVAKQVKRIWKG